MEGTSCLDWSTKTRLAWHDLNMRAQCVYAAIHRIRYDNITSVGMYLPRYACVGQFQSGQRSYTVVALQGILLYSCTLLVVCFLTGIRAHRIVQHFHHLLDRIIHCKQDCGDCVSATFSKHQILQTRLNAFSHLSDGCVFFRPNKPAFGSADCDSDGAS
ncbi:TPA: hypothetical protein ACH3X2_007760 [Trebouxia sp. C0005]